MKRDFQRIVIKIFLWCGVFLFPGNLFFAREAWKIEEIQAPIHQGREMSSYDKQKVKQNQKKSKDGMENQQQVKNVKKVKDTKPDLSKKNASPSISRPKGNTMPKGTGKASGVANPDNKQDKQKKPDASK